MKRFDSQTRAQSTLTGTEKNGLGNTRYNESGDKRSKTGMGNY